MKYYFIKKLAVQFISLVDSPANRKKIVFKSKDSFQKQFEISKKDEEKKIVYGIVYSPNELDAQNMFTDSSVIEEAAYDFLKNGNSTQVDNQHNFVTDVGFVCESWLIKEKDPVFPDEQVGAWAVGIKINNDEVWEKIISKEIQGISLYGSALLEEKNENESIKNFIKKKIISKEIQGISLYGSALLEEKNENESIKNFIKKISKYFQKEECINKCELNNTITQLNKDLNEHDFKISTQYLELNNLVEELKERINQIENHPILSTQPKVLRKNTPQNFWL